MDEKAFLSEKEEYKSYIWMIEQGPPFPATPETISAHSPVKYGIWFSLANAAAALSDAQRNTT